MSAPLTKHQLAHTLLTVARLKSRKQAAEQLGISRQTVLDRISKLESMVGGKIIEPYWWELTPLGKEIIKPLALPQARVQWRNPNGIEAHRWRNE